MFSKSSVCKENDKCMICLDEFKTNDKYIKCINEHRIHLDCITEHITRNNGLMDKKYNKEIIKKNIKTPCPYCKQQLVQKYYIL